MLKVLLIITSYSHDIATAFLTVSGILMVILYLKREELMGLGSQEAFVEVYRRVKLIAEASLLWILLAGVPRTVFYKKMEWSYIAGDTQIVAIGIKHVVMFLLVGALSYYWIRLSKYIKGKER
ncbi:MAG: hypothetical protein D6710_09140 [Nitrospirae bacterium]|nr:MAG: hypothetical protein D6710_09140 [Nitrospirota bacterium]